MKTLTSSILGIALLVGTALAAQDTKAPQPAPKTAAANTIPAKKVAHSKKKHRKSTKSVAKKTVAPVTPVAAKK